MTRALIIRVITDRQESSDSRYYFNRSWEVLRFDKRHKDPSNSENIKKPGVLDELLKVSELLSKEFPFVRMDFYIIQEKVLFGEFTFTPFAGFNVDILPTQDKFLGDLLLLEEF